MRAARNPLAPAPGVLQGDRPSHALDGLNVRTQQLYVQRAQEARRLAQDRDDAGLRLDLRDANRSGARQEVDRGGLPHPLLGRGRSEQGAILIERLRRGAGLQRLKARAHVAGEEQRLLQLRHEDLRVSSQHLVQSRSPTLRVPSDEEVGHAAGGRARDGGAPVERHRTDSVDRHTGGRRLSSDRCGFPGAGRLPRARHSPTVSRDRDPDIRSRPQPRP